MQVTNPDARQLYGTLFVVGSGGITKTKLHGFHIAGGKKEFITAKVEDCTRVGPTHVKAHQSCSFKWLSDHRINI